MSDCPCDDMFMTEDQAEEIVMAAEVGYFQGSRSELAHALILLENRERREQEEAHQ